jgi:predicted transposase YdaD
MTARTPHDALVRYVFSQLDTAREQLRSVLPAALVELLDWSTLRLHDGHYVDADLAGAESDLLFGVSASGQQVLVYVLFEHQSTSEPLMPLRLLRYMVRIWERWLADSDGSPRRVPAIVPVVLSHVDAGWQAATSMHELFEPQVVGVAGELLPSFRFVLDDLAAQTDEQLLGRPGTTLGKLTLRLLRWVRSAPDVARRMLGWMPLWRELWQGPNGREAAVALLRYVALAAGVGQRQDLEQLVEKMAGPESKEVIMTIAQQWAEQLTEEARTAARAEGRAEGKAEGKAEYVLQVLRARGIDVPDAARERVLGCRDLATLDRWLVRAVTCQVAEDLFS